MNADSAWTFIESGGVSGLLFVVAVVLCAVIVFLFRRLTLVSDKYVSMLVNQLEHNAATTNALNRLADRING